MSLYKRASTWSIDFAMPSGERVRRSVETSSNAEAKELGDKFNAESWRAQMLGEKPKYTRDEAGLKWLNETGYKRTHRDDMKKLAWLQQFLRCRVLAEISRDDIIAIGAHEWAASGLPTANRFLVLIRAILRKACFEWDWIAKTPQVKPYNETKRRVRWITRGRIDEMSPNARTT